MVHDDGKLRFICLAKKGQFDIVKLIISNYQFRTFSINLIAPYINGMTTFIFAVTCTVIRYSRVCYPSEKLFHQKMQLVYL